MIQEQYDRGLYAGTQGWRIYDDWYIEGFPYPSDYVRGWDAGILIWRRANSYWGA